VAISSRMLVVDLLLEKIPLWMITGFLVDEAHKVTESRLESFILNIYRSENKVRSMLLVYNSFDSRHFDLGRIYQGF
jgi:hypothetical protein